MKKLSVFTIAAVLLLFLKVFPCSAQAARAKIPTRVGTPYLGAIVVSDNTGNVLFEDNANALCYPASLVKLMVLLIIQEKIQQGLLRLNDPVRITAESARMGGSQVYLAENEVFPIEDLLYALIIQSANDAAVALAIHTAGSKTAFVNLMREKAQQLGMKQTEFHSVHGLPPGVGQKPDVSTARDLALLARAVLNHPDLLRYTSARFREFRDGAFEMRSHNRLLGSFEGCDGLKTGYFRAGGYSIIATARRGAERVIAIVTGSPDKHVRDGKARDLLSRGLPGEAPPVSPSGSRPSTARPDLKPLSPSGPEADHEPPVEAPASRKKHTGPLKTSLIFLLFVGLASTFYWIGRIGKK